MANSEFISQIMAMSTGIESTEGTTPASVVVGSATHLFRELNPLKIERDRRSLQALSSSHTKSADLVGRKLATLTPGMLMMGHNFLGQAGFRLDPILRMGGMAATVAGGGSTLTYKNRSDSYESGAVNFWMNTEDGTDSLLHKLNICRATLTISANAGEEIIVSPNIRGKYTLPTLVGSAISETLPTNIAEVLESIALTITPVGGSALTPQARVLSFEYAHTPEIKEQKDANQADGWKRLVIRGREDTLRLVIALDDTQYVTDFAPDADNGVLHDVDFLVGSVAGRRMQFTMRGQVDYELGDDGGDRILTLSYTARHTTAEEEAILVFT